MKDGESSEAPTQTGYKRESNLDLAKLMDTKVRVKCSGGREVVGTLRGYDDLVNLVLDDCGEFIRDPDTDMATEESRRLGTTLVRGPHVYMVSPEDGTEEITNPFGAKDGDE